jgi:hypothetical protein
LASSKPILKESEIDTDDFEKFEGSWDPDGFLEVDWPALAKQAGEPVDMPAWEAYWRTLPQAQPEGEPAA